MSDVIKRDNQCHNDDDTNVCSCSGLGRAEQRLGGEREEQRQEDGAKEGVEPGHASLHFVALCILVIILLILQLLHHLEVEDARDEHVQKRAHDRGNYDPEVRQDVVSPAVEHGEANYSSEEQVRDEILRDRLRCALVLARIAVYCSAIRIRSALRAKSTALFGPILCVEQSMVGAVVR